MRGWRKVGIAGVALVMTFILALEGTVDGGEWVSAVGLVLGLFGAANAVVHVGRKKE